MQGVVARGKKARIRLRQLHVVGKKEEENEGKKNVYDNQLSLTIFYATIITTTAAATSAKCSAEHNIIPLSSVIYDCGERPKLNRAFLIQVTWPKIIIILRIP